MHINEKKPKYLRYLQGEHEFDEISNRRTNRFIIPNIQRKERERDKESK